MESFEFIAYKEIVNDPYGMLGICTIRAYGKVVLRFKHVQGKDGKGIYFLPASYTINENGEKKYVKCFALDSTSDNEMLEEFIKDKVKRFLDGGSAKTVSMSMPYPHGLVKNQSPPDSNLPF